MQASWHGICVIDPWLRDYVGHGFNYANSISHAARSRGLEFRLVAARDCMPSIRQILPVEPIFRPLPMETSDRNNWAAQVLEKCAKLGLNYARFSGDLSAMDARSMDRGWILFLENARHFSLLALSRWLHKFRPAKAPAFVVMVWFSYFDKRKGRWGETAALVRLAFRMLERASRKYRIRLVADSQQLADEYRSLTRLPVRVLPLPCTSDVLLQSMGAPRFPLGHAMNVLLPGRPSLSRGIATLAAAIKRLVDHGQCADLTFTLQDYQTPGREPELDRAVVMLRQLGLPGLRIVQKTLDEREYYQMMADADLVVLPYFQEVYRVMSSGPFVEALALGKPVVVTEDTWMSDQLQRFGAGLTVRDRDADDLARVLCAARDDYPRLAEQAVARRERWIAYHNPNSFVNELLKVAEEY
jgi:glycosyltransferase involved in cell wall biosynthesis